MTNMDQAEGKFTQLKGKIKETWGKLTDNDIMLYKGQHEQFLGKLKEHYGLAKEDAEKKLKALEDTITSTAASISASVSKAVEPAVAAAKAPTPMPGVAK